MMQNLAQIAQLMRGRDAQSVVMQMIQNNKNIDPNIAQLITFAQRGDEETLFNLANTLFAQQGLDLKQELSSFLDMMK